MNKPEDKMLGDIGEIELAEDERRTRGQQRPVRAEGAAAKPARPGGKPNPWFLVTILLTILVALMGAWFFRELSALKGQLELTLNDSSRQLGDLASQLSATDESLNQSSDQIADTLKLHDSEIRKLWGVSNDRNKKWIQELQSSVTALEKQRGQLSKSVEGVRADLKTLQASVKQTETARNQLQTRVDLMADSLRQLEAKLAAQQKTSEAISRIRPQLDELAGLQSAGEGIDGRLTELEAAINAVDAYRREVNVRLDKLEGR